LYLMYGVWNVLIAALTLSLTLVNLFKGGPKELVLLGVALLFAVKAGLSWLCYTFIESLEKQLLAGSTVVTKVVVTRTATGGVATHVFSGERFDLCDRMCRFHNELFKPFENIDTCSEWEAVLQNRPKNIRLAYVSMNLVSFWFGILGSSSAMLLFKFLDYKPEMFDKLDSLITWEAYWLMFGATYVLSYGLHLIVNIGATRRWLHVGRLAYLVTTLVYGCTAGWFGREASHHFAFGIPAAFYGVTAAANAFCCSFVSQLRTDLDTTAML